MSGLTTALEVIGGGLLIAGTSVLFGVGAGLIVAGVVLLAVSRGLSS